MDQITWQNSFKQFQQNLDQQKNIIKSKLKQQEENKDEKISLYESLNELNELIINPPIINYKNKITDKLIGSSCNSLDETKRKVIKLLQQNEFIIILISAKLIKQQIADKVELEEKDIQSAFNKSFCEEVIQQQQIQLIQKKTESNQICQFCKVQVDKKKMKTHKQKCDKNPQKACLTCGLKFSGLSNHQKKCSSQHFDIQQIQPIDLTTFKFF